MSKALRLIVPTLAAAAMIAVSIAPVPADAQGARKQRRGSYGTVTACSRYGRGCVTGPVRRGAVEDEVRMPGGTWIGCRGDCRETLREETVDYWETLRERRGDSWM